MQRLTPVAQTRFAFRTPSVAIGDHGIPVPHPLEDVMRFGGRAMRV